MFACIHLPTGAAKRLRECASAFAPEAELTAPNTILFDVSRLYLLYGGPDQIAQAVAKHAQALGLQANIAIAPNTETALIAVRNFPGVTVIPEDAADALSRLYIENLPLTAELWETLESWGIRTFHDLAGLPEAGLAERFGPEGVYLHRLARGTVDRPLRVQIPEVTFEQQVDLEHSISLLEPLLFILSRILNDQCEKLQSSGFSTNHLCLILSMENGTHHRRELRLPVPMRQSQAILKLLQLDLEAHPAAAAVTAVHLLLKPVQPRSVQNGMFLPATPAPDKLEVTLARIRALVGELNAGVPELLNTHRPQPFQLVARQPTTNPRQLWDSSSGLQLAFRYFQPPLIAQVEVANGFPLRLTAHLALEVIRGSILTCAGPWRSSGDWWTENPWSREEWDVSLNDGALYRIYRDPTGWYIEGMYD